MKVSKIIADVKSKLDAKVSLAENYPMSGRDIRCMFDFYQIIIPVAEANHIRYADMYNIKLEDDQRDLGSYLKDLIINTRDVTSLDHAVDSEPEFIEDLESENPSRVYDMELCDLNEITPAEELGWIQDDLLAIYRAEM